MKVNILFVCSYSNGYRDFQSNLSSLFPEHITTVYLNSCCALGSTVTERPISCIIHSVGKDIIPKEFYCPGLCDAVKNAFPEYLPSKNIESVTGCKVENECIHVIEMEDLK